MTDTLRFLQEKRHLDSEIPKCYIWEEDVKEFLISQLEKQKEFLENLNTDGIKIGSNQSYKRIINKIKEIEKEIKSLKESK